jgi:acyl dehydratase
MVEDNNPLFIDPKYAATTEHGAVLCPPSGWLALYFASLGPWPAAFEPLFPIVPTPGKRIVNMSQDVEWFARIKAGDHLSVVRRIVDVYQKGITIDPEAVWIVSDADITNQRDELVCRIRNTFLTHRTPAEVTAANAA